MYMWLPKTGIHKLSNLCLTNIRSHGQSKEFQNLRRGPHSPTCSWKLFGSAAKREVKICVLPVPETLSLGLWCNHCDLWTSKKCSPVFWLVLRSPFCLSTDLCLGFQIYLRLPAWKRSEIEVPHILNFPQILLIPQATLGVHYFMLISTFHPRYFFPLLLLFLLELIYSWFTVLC